MAKTNAPDSAPAKNAPLLFALRLTNDVINASDKTLEEAAALCEKIAVFFGGVIFIGIVLEIGLAIAHLPQDSRLGYWGPVVADGLVAAGVGLEVLFGFRGAAIQSELTRRANAKLEDAHKMAWVANGNAAGALAELGRVTDELREAVERAAKLEAKAAESEKQAQELRLKTAESELKLRRLSNPRHPDRQIFLKELSGQPKPLSVHIMYSAEGADCPTLAAWIAAHLREAEWPLDPPNPSVITSSGGISGASLSATSAAQRIGGQPWGVTVLDSDIKPNDGLGHTLFVALCKSLDGEMVAATRASGIPTGHLRVVVAPRP